MEEDADSKMSENYPTNITNNSRKRSISSHNREPSPMSTDNRAGSPMANNQKERSMAAKQREDAAKSVSPSEYLDLMGDYKQNAGSGRVFGFGSGNLMGGNNMTLWNKWRMVMGPKDEKKFRMPGKDVKDDKMEMMIRQKELSIQKRIPFGEGDWGGYIKDDKKITKAPGGGFRRRQFVEVIKSMRVMQDDRGRGAYVEAVTACKKPITAFCHFKEVQISRRKEDRHNTGCKEKGYSFINSRNLEEVVLEGELFIKPSHKEKYAQQCEVIKARLAEGEMWFGIECPNKDCKRWSWRA